MKQMIYFVSILLLAAACNNQAPVEEKAPVKAAINMADYPYTLDHAYKDWQAGKQENAIMVLKMIKAWENKNTAECASYFADEVEMNTDYVMAKMSRDSIISMLESSYKDIASIKVDMQDWESVVSADGKDEWVTLWYTQAITDTNGTTDSVNVVNDAKIVNGKIAVFDEYVQHFPKNEKE